MQGIDSRVAINGRGESLVGKTLGHYEVIEPLGAGGMGEVYRARDGKLNRDVAIKVLPPMLADDPERLARMQREAQVLAALNHPNIAAIYGLEEADGITFLAMELAAGQTLAECVSDGPLAVDEAMKIALQVAEALEAAHERGIVHRDLKPANIQVATEGSAAGQVKVLDFGLAKATEGDGDSRSLDLSASPTMAAATRAGVIMGTAAYMSPEQARGKQVDKRTDIWAFGCVVFEILTGRRAFQGETITDILAAIVHQEPQWEALPPDTPLRIRELLRRCLKKQPDERLRDVGECRIAVREYLADPEGEKKRARAAGADVTGASWKLATSVAGAALLVGVVATWLAMRPGPGIAPAVMRFEISLPEGSRWADTRWRLLAISPDGTRVAYRDDAGIVMRSFAEYESVRVAGGEDGRSPFFSPDGQQIGFWREGRLQRVAVTGGAPVTIAELSDTPAGVSWASNGTVYVGLRGQGVWQVAGTGGTPEQLIQLEPGEYVHGPQLLPGGKWILFTLASAPGAWNEASIVAQSLSTGERRVLVSGGTDGRYVATGHLLYYRDGSLLAMPFDVRNVSVTPGPVPVLTGVQASLSPPSGAAHYSLSDAGALAYVPGDYRAEISVPLQWRSRDGAAEDLPLPGGNFEYPRLSPDGRRIAVRIADAAGSAVWIYEVERGGLYQLTTEGRADRPVWSADSEWVYFASDRPGDDLDIWRRRVDLSVPSELVLDGEGTQLPISISDDGTLLLISDGASVKLMTLPDGEPATLRDEAGGAALSPDGQFIAYQPGTGGAPSQAFVQEIETGRVWPVFTDGGVTQVLWSKAGDEIFMTVGAPAYTRMFSVAVSDDPASPFAPPRELFQYARRGGQGGPFDVTADGQRFLVVAMGPNDEVAGSMSDFNLVLNWVEELKARVPTGR